MTAVNGRLAGAALQPETQAAAPAHVLLHTKLHTYSAAASCWSQTELCCSISCSVLSRCADRADLCRLVLRRCAVRADVCRLVLSCSAVPADIQLLSHMLQQLGT